MIGLAGRRVPIPLAVVPASIMSVLMMVGGIAWWSIMIRLAISAWSSTGFRLVDLIKFLGSTQLLPVWGVALAVGTYCRRRVRDVWS